MSRSFTALFTFVALCTACVSADSIPAKDLVGAYSRRQSGLYSETLSLRSDGSYVFLLKFDIGAEEESGAWAVKDNLVILTPKQRGKMTMPSRFVIVRLSSVVALSVLEVATASHREDSETRLFRPLPKPANKAPEPTP